MLFKHEPSIMSFVNEITYLQILLKKQSYTMVTHNVQCDKPKFLCVPMLTTSSQGRQILKRENNEFRK